VTKTAKFPLYTFTGTNNQYNLYITFHILFYALFTGSNVYCIKAA